MDVAADAFLEAGNEAGLNKLYAEVRKIFDEGAKESAPRKETPAEPEPPAEEVGLF